MQARQSFRGQGAPEAINHTHHNAFVHVAATIMPHESMDTCLRVCPDNACACLLWVGVEERLSTTLLLARGAWPRRIWPAALAPIPMLRMNTAAWASSPLLGGCKQCGIGWPTRRYGLGYRSEEVLPAGRAIRECWCTKWAARARHDKRGSHRQIAQGSARSSLSPLRLASKVTLRSGGEKARTTPSTLLLSPRRAGATASEVDLGRKQSQATTANDPSAEAAA